MNDFKTRDGIILSCCWWYVWYVQIAVHCWMDYVSLGMVTHISMSCAVLHSTGASWVLVDAPKLRVVYQFLYSIIAGVIGWVLTAGGQKCGTSVCCITLSLYSLILAPPCHMWSCGLPSCIHSMDSPLRHDRHVLALSWSMMNLCVCQEYQNHKSNSNFKLKRIL